MKIKLRMLLSSWACKQTLYFSVDSAMIIKKNAIFRINFAECES
jgi:hypothetical protein